PPRRLPAQCHSVFSHDFGRGSRHVLYGPSDAPVVETAANPIIEVRAFGIGSHELLVNGLRHGGVLIDGAVTKLQLQQRCSNVVGHASEQRGVDRNGGGECHFIAPPPQGSFCALGNDLLVPKLPVDSTVGEYGSVAY